MTPCIFLNLPREDTSAKRRATIVYLIQSPHPPFYSDSTHDKLELETPDEILWTDHQSVTARCTKQRDD